MVYFDPSFTMPEIKKAADAIDGKIIAKRDGSFVIVPRMSRDESEVLEAA